MKRIVKTICSLSMIFGFMPQNIPESNNVHYKSKLLRYNQYIVQTTDSAEIFGLHGNFCFVAYFNITTNISPGGQIKISDIDKSVEIVSYATDNNQIPLCEITDVKMYINNNRLIIDYNIETDIDLTAIIPKTTYSFQFEYLSD